MSKDNLLRPITLTNVILVFLAAFIAGIIFIVDINVPVGVSISSIYCIVILYSWLFPGNFSSIYAGIVCSALVIIGYFLSSDLNIPGHLPLANRIISIIVIWVCTTLITVAKKSFDGLEKLNINLERQVARRTEDLKQGKALLKEAQSLAKIGSWTWYPSTNKVIWSDEMFSILGLDKSKHTGKVEDLFAFIHPDDKEKVKKASEKAIEEKKAIPIEYRIFDAEGVLKYIRGDGSQEIDDNGNLVRLYGTLQDITERVKKDQELKDYSKQLETKNKELEQFVYIASHDLQEPLRTISSFTELISEKYNKLLDDVGTKSMGYIIDASKRMSLLIKGLLDYSRIGRNMDKVEVNCDEMIKAIESDMIVAINESNATLQKDSLPTVKGYEIELRLLLQNLISNAIKFRDKDTNPVIKITSREEPSHWTFSVSDNGIGIDSKHKERIFIIFQRLNSKKEYAGTGIGLAHCKKIVDLHGGEIWVDSKEGNGSTFYFTIPK